MKIDSKLLLKYVVRIAIISWVAFIIGLLSSYIFDFMLVNTMFIIGMILIIIGGLSLSGGITAGMSLKALGRNNAQYQATLNNEIVTKENEIKNNNLISNKTPRVNMISILISGVICILFVVILL